MKVALVTAVISLLYALGLTQASRSLRNTIACPINGQATVADIVENDPTGQLSTLSAALKAVNLTGLVASEGPLNLIAPIDSAFQDVLDMFNISSGTLLNQTTFLDRVLKAHVVFQGAVCQGELSGTVPTALAASKFTFDPLFDTVTDSNGNVANILTSVPASNGMLVVIDTVLLPLADVALPPLVERPSAQLLHKSIDTNNDGLVTPGELRVAAADAGILLPDGEIPAFLDVNLDGALDLVEFIQSLDQGLLGDLDNNPNLAGQIADGAM